MRHDAWLTLVLCGRDDVPKTFTFPPRIDGLFPWVGSRQICVCNFLLVPKVAQGLCEPRKEVALMCLERAPSKRRLGEAREQETLRGGYKPDQCVYVCMLGG